MARKSLKFRPTAPAPPEWQGTHKVLADIIAEQMGTDLGEITRDARFGDDLGFDSLDDIEVIMALEEALDIEIDEELLLSVKTVGEALPILDKIIAAKAAQRKP